MQKLPSVMAHQFSQVPKAEIQRSQFDRSHGYKTTFNAGLLIPIFVDEALPGDTFSLRMQAFARLATPIAPLMDNLYMDFHFFAVPNRLVWSNFKRFMGEQANPADSVDFLIPEMTAPVGGYANSTIYDYFGLPTQIAGFKHQTLPLRAFNLIWNEWYRDQNLQNSVTVRLTDSGDLSSDFSLLRRGKRHDYFTSCLPWPQKGNTAVSIPLGTSAPVITQATEHTIGTAQQTLIFRNSADGSVTGQTRIANIGSTGRLYQSTSAGGTLEREVYPSNLIANLTSATAATINQLRQAFAIQKLLERDARGGTRYIEIIKAHFGVTSPDARQQRPEYLGGGTVPINLHAVPQTSATSGQPTPQGNITAFGTAFTDSIGFVKSFTEHCILIGLVSVRADLTYQQGLDRMWSRRTKYDLFWPALSNIGEQAVLNKEIMTQGTAADDQTFGFQERWAEYRYKPSKITGRMRSNDAQTLHVWHLSQQFLSLPTLNSTFIQEDPPMARILAVGTQPHIIYDSYIKLKCARPMPLYSVPGMLDRF